MCIITVLSPTLTSNLSCEAPIVTLSPTTSFWLIQQIRNGVFRIPVFERKITYHDKRLGTTRAVFYLWNWTCPASYKPYDPQKSHVCRWICFTCLMHSSVGKLQVVLMPHFYLCNLCCLTSHANRKIRFTIALIGGKDAFRLFFDVLICLK